MRKIIQLVETRGNLIALCDDGTVWYFIDGSWALLKQRIPQDNI